MLIPILLIVPYLIGSIPFGYLIARSKGVDLFAVGSGNIGATNVGRVLGRKLGILVFVLDFLKGALPVAFVPAICRSLGHDGEPATLDGFRVTAALGVILGHMFPIYLRFRGGKGVATGAGTVFVLVPGPALIALAIWLATVASSRMVSLASIMAACGLVIGRALATSLSNDTLIVTIFCALAATIVIIKHRSNLVRIRLGQENLIEARPWTGYLQRALHLLALSLWLGSAFFFNLLAAPTIFATFKEVVRAEPGDRTAFIPINRGLNEDQQKDLANALAGAAVGPVFPLFFGLHAICGAIALITALGWWKQPGKANHWRVYIIGIALAIVAIGWPISQRVTELRLLRFSPESTVADAAKSDFVTWHLYSLGLSLLSLVLVFAAMLLAAVRLPQVTDKELQ